MITKHWEGMYPMPDTRGYGRVMPEGFMKSVPTVPMWRFEAYAEGITWKTAMKRMARKFGAAYAHLADGRLLMIYAAGSSFRQRTVKP